MPSLEVIRITPEEWKRRTAVALKARSKELLAVDHAYTNFYNFDATTSDHKTAETLLILLNDYLILKGRDWTRIERNKASKGMMKQIYDELKKALKGHARVAYIMGSTHAGVNRIQNYDIPHSRLGVLYLLGNIHVDLDYLGHALGGMTALSTVAGIGGASEFQEHNSPTHYQEALRSMGSVDGRQVSSGVAVRGGAAVLNTAQKIAGGTGTKTSVGYMPTLALMPNYRSPLGATGLGILGSVKQAVGNSINDLDIWWKRVVATLQNLMEEVRRMMEVKLELTPHMLPAIVGAAIKAVMAEALQYILTSSVPYVSGGMAMLTGLIRTAEASVTRIRAYCDRKPVVVMQGHPEEIANKIEGSMNWAIGEGLLDMMKGAVKLSAEVLLPGAGALASAIVSAFDWLARTIKRLMEASRLNAWLADAKRKYQSEKTLHAGAPTEGDLRGIDPDAQGSILFDQEGFARFFADGCNASPVVPMLVLNSGLGGSLFTLIRMTDDRDSLLDGQTFAAGDKYWGRLKAFGAGYLSKCGFKLISTDAADKFLTNILGHAVRDHSGPASMTSKFLAAARA